MNQRQKECELLRMTGEHPFGMPVDGKQKLPVAFDALDDPVRGHGVDRESRRQIANDLVVGTSYAQLSGMKNPGQAGAWHNRNVVDRLCAVFPRALVRWIGLVPVGQVLIEAAAHGDIQELQSAADS